MMDFQTFARINGVEINNLVISDKIMRCGTVAKPRSNNGAYLFDGKRGWVMDWANGGELQVFGSEPKEYTAEEKRAWAKKKQEQEQELAQRHKTASSKAQEIINTCTLKDHGYLSYKGLIGAQGLVTEDNKLIVPMSSIDGELKGIQSICWNEDTRSYDKKMIYGMQAKGAIYRIGSPKALETILCEGLATGLSIKKAIEQMSISACVLVCFSANNIVAVAKHFSQKTYVFADRDESQTGEMCALKTGLPFCMSDEIGDANDLHQSKGLTAVIKKIMGVRANR